MARRSGGAVMGQGPYERRMLSSSPVPGASKGGGVRSASRGGGTKGSFVNISRAMAKDCHHGPAQWRRGLHHVLLSNTPRALASTGKGIGRTTMCTNVPSSPLPEALGGKVSARRGCHTTALILEVSEGMVKDSSRWPAQGVGAVHI